MGRKIPAKKHRGVKDPLVQQARRIQSLKGKINSPPKDPDEQPVPRTLTELFAFKNNIDKSKKKQNKSLPSKADARNASQSKNPVARLRKVPGESGRDFSLRISGAVRALHGQQLAYPDDAEPEDAKGERMAALRRRRRKKRGNEGEEGAERPLPRQRALLGQAKLKKAAEEAEWARRSEAQYERVRFGDVAHAPPALRPPARAARTPALADSRRGLLLAPLLAGAGAGTGAEAEAEAARRERARLAAVSAYRALNKERRARAGAPKR